ncbi:hypothetical protein [uncultured Parabacteroides sp.]|uniref:hypothetical protein n=1 Tax=uncultured Parabacteroides sp. TaxID=512312 RepID=UPI002803957F|nr:hypothetical protein [uncultured Parabacteroides sp.]
MANSIETGCPGRKSLYPDSLPVFGRMSKFREEAKLFLLYFYPSTEANGRRYTA